MEITFLGTGVAIPQRGRVQSGVLVRLEEKPLLIDCGSGVLSRFPEAEISHTEVDTVLLSHRHLDHVADLLCLLKANWLRGKTDMRIYGPEGTEDWLSRVLGAYAVSYTHLRAHETGRNLVCRLLLEKKKITH